MSARAQFDNLEETKKLVSCGKTACAPAFQYDPTSPQWIQNTKIKNKTDPHFALQVIVKTIRRNLTFQLSIADEKTSSIDEILRWAKFYIPEKRREEIAKRVMNQIKRKSQERKSKNAMCD